MKKGRCELLIREVYYSIIINYYLSSTFVRTVIAGDIVAVFGEAFGFKEGDQANNQSSKAKASDLVSLLELLQRDMHGN